MLRVLVNFLGTAHLREIRFNRESLEKVTIEKLKTYLPDQKCELLLLRINNINSNILLQDKKTIGFYVNSITNREDGSPAPTNFLKGNIDVVHILVLSHNHLSAPNDQIHLQDLLNSKGIQPFLEKLKIRSNPPLLRESMRLKDIRMMKFSRKDEEQYLKYLQVERPTKKFPTILSNIIFDTISEEPLPFIF